jgi:hypothetical protein
MIYFDSDMSKSTNMVVCFDWKTVIYIYVCGKCHTQCMLPMEKSVTFTGTCANEIIPSINCSFVYKAKEGCYVRIVLIILIPLTDCTCKITSKCFIFYNPLSQIETTRSRVTRLILTRGKCTVNLYLYCLKKGDQMC